MTTNLSDLRTSEKAREAIALGAGHQCQPSLSMPRAARRPALPIGSGGSGKVWESG